MNTVSAIISRLPVSLECAKERITQQVTESIPSKIAAFQQKQGIWITSNCQHIQEGSVNFYGIHKDAQASRDKETTRALYKDLKSHVLQLMGLPASTKIVQVVGDSASFSAVGTAKGKSVLREKLSQNVVVLYGFTGHKEEDGTRCVNASVTDVIEEKCMQSSSVANLVGFHTPLALKNWGCTGPQDLQHYVIVYSDDETRRETGTVFGDDVTTSDFFADSLIMLEGGAQSFRQACNALLLDQPIFILSGLRERSKAYAIEMLDQPLETPYFAAAKFISDVIEFVGSNNETVIEKELNDWYGNYFGRGKCYVGDPRRGDFDTKQKLVDEAWNLFVTEKLYLKFDSGLVNILTSE